MCHKSKERAKPEAKGRTAIQRQADTRSVGQ